MGCFTFLIVIIERAKYDQLCQLILPIQSNDPSSGLFVGDDVFMRCRRRSISVLKQIVIRHYLRESLCITDYCHKLEGHPSVTQMNAITQSSYYWPQIAAGITAAVHNCEGSAENWVSLHKQTSLLKLLPASESL